MKLASIVLANAHVRLEPLDEAHRDGLRAAANADQEIWPTLYPVSLAGEHFDGFWSRVRNDQRTGFWLPFAVYVADRCIGLSCFLRNDPANRVTEIGSTYYHPDFRGGAVNPSCKYLMLGHAFACGANRVQFRVDALNARSRAAVLKLGAVQEGILRRDVITWTGRVRDTVHFSILAEEWPARRAALEIRLSRF